MPLFKQSHCSHVPNSDKLSLTHGMFFSQYIKKQKNFFPEAATYPPRALKSSPTLAHIIAAVEIPVTTSHTSSNSNSKAFQCLPLSPHSLPTSFNPNIAILLSSSYCLPISTYSQRNAQQILFAICS